MTDCLGGFTMIKRYNNLSFLFFLPGIVAQMAGLVMLLAVLKDRSGDPWNT
jgi:hypothetical protein